VKLGLQQLKNYDFHDGYLIDIKHDHDRIELSLESSQIDCEDFKNIFLLSDHGTLKGKLHFVGVQKITQEGIHHHEKLRKQEDEGDLFSIDFFDNKVSFVINWLPYSSKPDRQNSWISYEIEAEQIYWENIPNLPNPYWK